MNSGIYALYWNNTESIYIGKSIRLSERFNEHLRLLKNNKHYNYKLQAVYLEQGIPEFIVLEYAIPSILNSLEVTWIEEFNSYYNGLNLTIGGDSSYGEDSSNSCYSNIQIEEVFKLLVPRVLSHREIAQITKVSIDVVKKVSQCKLHTWLEELYPKEYCSLLSSIKPEHNSGENHNMSTTSNKDIEDLFINYLVDRPVPLREISRITAISYGIVSLVACGESHIWLKEKYPVEYDKMLSNRDKPYKIYPKLIKDGEVVEVINASAFCSERGLQHPNLCRVFKGERLSHKGWSLYHGT